MATAATAFALARRSALADASRPQAVETLLASPTEPQRRKRR